MLFTTSDDIPQDMKLELEAASTFIVGTVRKARKGDSNLEENDYQKFHAVFLTELSVHYKQHWYPDNPVKGSGYRCIRNNGKLDPLLTKIASKVGISSSELHASLPFEFTIWIDPSEVCCRFGEEGSVNILYQDKRSKSPPVTPPSKKIRETVEPPTAPVKNSQSQHILQVTPPPLKQHRIISPSNSARRTSPPHFNLLQHQFNHIPFYNYKENCKDVMRTNHMMPFSESQSLYVSS